MADSPIDYSTRGALAFITLNRPERLNAIGAGMTAGLRDAVARANGEGDVRVIITARGGARVLRRLRSAGGASGRGGRAGARGRLGPGGGLRLHV